jgi:molybdate transport system substrate-binding protein
MLNRCIAAIALAILPALAGAAEIIVFCPGAVRSVVTELSKSYTQATGHTIKFVYGTAGSVAKQVAGGDSGDVVITTEELMANLANSGRVDAKSTTALGSMGVGVAVRKGIAQPDVRTVDAFKAAMLAARSITFADPAFGGQSGIHVAKVFEQLGIAQELKPKLQLRPGAPEAFVEVARGDIEVGLGQISEILANKGLVLVGPLPPAIQSSVAFATARHSGSKAADAATAFIGHLTSPLAKQHFRELGFDVK